jgi:hypothetical protein
MTAFGFFPLRVVCDGGIAVAGRDEGPAELSGLAE